MTSLALPSGTSLYYNGYDFGVETEMVHVDVRPNYDRSGRTVVNTTNSFTFKTKVTTAIPAVSTSAAISNIKRQLTQPGGWFKMLGFGYGDLNVNNPDFSGLRDVKWGPKPQILSFEQIGFDQAWNLMWRIDVTILDQCTTGTYHDKVMAFNYRIAYNTDRSGYSSRTYSGYLEIPNTRFLVADRSVIDNADRWFNQVLPPVPTQFRREARQRELSEDKSQLTFSVVDTEVRGYVPPKDVVFSRVTHSIRNNPKNFIQWYGTISASYEMARKVPKSRCWKLFWDMAQARILNAESIVTKKNNGNGFVYPLAFTASGGDLHSAESGTFNLTFLLVLPKRKKQSLKEATQYLADAAGLWLVPPGSDYKEWSSSMIRDDVWHPRGYAKLEFHNTDDKLIDLCFSEKKIKAGGDDKSKLDDPSKKKKREIKVSADSAFRGKEAPSNPFNVKTPAAKSSWIAYEQRIILHQKDNRSVLVPLPATPIKYTPPTSDVDDTKGLQLGYATTTPKHIIQTRAAPLLYVTVVGRAVRAGYEITPPTLTKIGGQDAIPANDGSDSYTPWLVGNLGVPIVAATWSRRYILAGPPQIGLTVPDNPIYGTIATAGAAVEPLGLVVQK